jgi:PH domain
LVPISARAFLQVWILKEGWLSKRASGLVAAGTWQRRWFVLQSDGSLYHLSRRGGDDRRPVVNLCLAAVKTDGAAVGGGGGGSRDRDARGFSLVSPSHTYCLQADSEAERGEWIDTIQARALRGISCHMLPSLRPAPGPCGHGTHAATRRRLRRRQ